jgi:hypothetical protein
MRKIEKENEFNREEDITLEELRQSSEFEKMSNEEVLQIIEFLKIYSYLVYQAHRKINCCDDENEMVIDINKNNEIKLAA